jgi:hypothetical protein
MDENKISVNIGGHTFEASGPDANEQFKVFVDLLKEGVGQNNVGIKGVAPGIEARGGDGDHGSRVVSISQNDFQKVFETDPNKENLYLKYPPEIEDDDKKARVKAAILMILYGFKEVLAVSEVGVIRLSNAIEESGLGKFPRLTFATDPLNDDGLILKSGNRSGAKYRMTPAGLRKAIELVGKLVEKIG